MPRSRSHPAYEKHHKWIIEALIALMKEKNYQQISIKDIVTQADVSRQTFYRHFQSKDAIIEAYSQTICVQLTDRIKALEKKDLYHITYTYFTFWLDYRELLDLLMQHDCEYLVYDSYQKIVHESVILLDQIIQSPDYSVNTATTSSSDPSHTFTQSFIIGGLYNMKIKWMKNGYQESPEEMAEWVERLFNDAPKEDL